MCKPFIDNQKLNPNTQLMIIAECSEGCIGSVVNSFYFSIFKEWKFDQNDPQIKWIECISSDTSTAINLKKRLIYSKLFIILVNKSPHMCFLNSTNTIGIFKLF
jgi:hypothetical protein